MSDEARQAAEVFERMLRDMGASAPSPPRAERVRLAQLRTAAARTIDLYGQLLQTALDAYTDLAQGALQPAAAAPVDAALVLNGRPGEAVSAPVWVHNLTETAVAAELRLTELVAPSGECWDGGAFRPARLEVAPGVSGEATLTLTLPDAPGVYHGHVLAGGLPDAALAVRVTVAR